MKAKTPDDFYSFLDGLTNQTIAFSNEGIENYDALRPSRRHAFLAGAPSSGQSREQDQNTDDVGHGSHLGQARLKI
ncbi:hypothetical protein FXB40_24135 [Bradyrhizobium rifense]|uniref:Uncharacterized protein n=1 Tax=Bradyrhizobium rifense TaxID=515499 RepID=A0A5D3KGG1_9BRAD|nr:hypothetical protein [Bradyrhizobium rifense]TYL92548.1 hypothetical protein FXB40_24135 [Bradyrhizobium rifense]